MTDQPTRRPTASPTIRAARTTTPRCWRATSASASRAPRRPTSRSIASARTGSGVAAGKALDRYGNPLTIKLTGKVEPYFKDKKEG